MKKSFTIGEVAKLANVSAHTLRYYDKIGLLKPKETGKANGYRYYTYEDFLFLDTIRYLRTIGMSLEDIREHFAKRSVNETLQLYMKQLKETQRRIKELEGIEEHLDRIIGYLEKGKDLTKYNTPHFSVFPERYAVMVSGLQDENDFIGNPFDYESQYNMLICSLAEQFYQGNLRTMGNEMAVKSYADLCQGLFTRTIAAGNMLVENDGKRGEKLPEGTYGCIYHKGSADDIAVSYELLMSYIENEGYEIAGDSYELFLVDSVDTADENEFVTYIQILVREKQLSLKDNDDKL